MFQLKKSLSNPNHPYFHFGTGNLETLYENPKKNGKDIREELLKFHDSYYSANIMKLCVLGREPLDQLTEWAVEKFKNVRNKDIEPPSFPGHPLTENELTVCRAGITIILFFNTTLETNICQACQRCSLFGNDIPFPRSASFILCSGMY